MTDEQLEIGQRLSEKIGELKNRISKWERANRIHSVTIHYPTDYPVGGSDYTDSGLYVNFDVLKTLTLQAMRTELELLEKEYREL